MKKAFLWGVFAGIFLAMIIVGIAMRLTEKAVGERLDDLSAQIEELKGPPEQARVWVEDELEEGWWSKHAVRITPGFSSIDTGLSPKEGDSLQMVVGGTEVLRMVDGNHIVIPDFSHIKKVEWYTPDGTLKYTFMLDKSGVPFVEMEKR